MTKIIGKNIFCILFIVFSTNIFYASESYSANPKYFLTFYGKQHSITKITVGHAFVSFIREDPLLQQTVIDGCWGLYPNILNTGIEELSIGNVKGQIKNDWNTQRTVGYTVEVSATEYFNAKTVKSIWESKSTYMLITNDCVEFAEAIAQCVKCLKLPSRVELGKLYNIKTFLFPLNYVSELKRLNNNDPSPCPSNVSLFLFDVSGSMNEAGKSGNSKIIEAKGAAIATLGNLNQTNSSSQPYVAIKTFSGACSQDPTNPILDYTSDLKQAENAIMSIPMPNGGTPLPQAIEVSKADLLKCLKSNNQKQGKLIILSDGQSSCGAIRPPDIYGKNPVIVTNPQGTVANPLVKNYAIGFNIPPGSEAERDLQYLAQMSGGKYVNAQDQLELTKAFQKFSRVYVPKPYPTIDTLSSTFKILFAKGINSIEDEEFDKALESYKQFTKNTPKDCNGFYNLALMYEANEYFKAAIKNYETYLQLCPNPQDKDYVRKQIESLNIEHDKYVEYNKKIVMSDLDYLNLHFKKIQNGESVALAVEFIGFISEKWIYYRNLAEIIESDDRLFKTNANEVFKGLKECVETIKRNPQAWDRDATPVLSRTYLNMERLIKSF